MVNVAHITGVLGQDCTRKKRWYPSLLHPLAWTATIWIREKLWNPSAISEQFACRVTSWWKFVRGYFMTKIRFLFLFIFMFLYLMFFIFVDQDVSLTRFHWFSVPINEHLGGDSQNIRMKAYCEQSLSTPNCINSDEAIHNLGLNSPTPAYNYPAIWSFLYGAFGNYSQIFFKHFWYLNCLLFLLSTFIFSASRAPYLLPLLIVSPPSLLLIERGNIDGYTYALTFFPILFAGKSLIPVFIGLLLGTMSKIFPIFGLLFILFDRKKNHLSRLLLSACVISLCIFTVLSVPDLVEKTPTGFAVSYGLLSLYGAPVFREHFDLTTTTLCVYICGIWALTFYFYKYGTADAFLTSFKRLSIVDKYLFFTSALIFMGTFLFAISWAYRLVFLFPMLLVVCQFSDLYSRALVVLAVATLWLPILPLGWVLQNVFTYFIFLFLFPVIFLLGKYYYSHDMF